LRSLILSDIFLAASEQDRAWKSKEYIPTPVERDESFTSVLLELDINRRSMSREYQFRCCPLQTIRVCWITNGRINCSLHTDCVPQCGCIPS
jgi:hypothetical protein